MLDDNTIWKVNPTVLGCAIHAEIHGRPVPGCILCEKTQAVVLELPTRRDVRRAAA